MKFASTVQRLGDNYAKYMPTIITNFPDETYQEILNVKSFNVEALWSSIGGFVGIFLGYSLMQVPELIFNTVRYFKQNLLADLLQ